MAHTAVDVRNDFQGVFMNCNSKKKKKKKHNFLDHIVVKKDPSNILFHLEFPLSSVEFLENQRKLSNPDSQIYTMFFAF